jgi:ribosomal protein S18 acetylase RimI-like enzyme
MSNGILTYREITREEIPQSAQIVFDAFNQMAEQTGSPKTPNVEVVSTRLTEYLDDEGIPGLLYGGFVDGVQMGFFMLRKLGIDEETWEINMLAVAPAFQRRGYGAKLLSCALQKVLDLCGVLAVCAVTEGNDHVLELLAREGFTCEASGVPVGGLSIWMLRKDMKNAAAAVSCAPEDCEGCSGGCCSL